MILLFLCEVISDVDNKHKDAVYNGLHNEIAPERPEGKESKILSTGRSMHAWGAWLIRCCVKRPCLSAVYEPTCDPPRDISTMRILANIRIEGDI